jgi:hypothetical protein
VRLVPSYIVIFYKISQKVYINFQFLDQELVAFLKLSLFSRYIAKITIQISYNKMASLKKISLFKQVCPEFLLSDSCDSFYWFIK